MPLLVTWFYDHFCVLFLSLLIFQLYPTRRNPNWHLTFHTVYFISPKRPEGRLAGPSDPQGPAQWHLQNAAGPAAPGQPPGGIHALAGPVTSGPPVGF